MDLMPLVSAVVTYLSICCTSVVAQGEGVVEVPGGVADSAGKVLYLTGKQAGVVAVDAESGTVLWESLDGSRPLALVEDRLAVLSARPEPGQGNAMRVRYLDIREKGARVGESEPVILPVLVGSGRDYRGGGLTFHLRASRVGNELHLHWRAATYPFGGAPGGAPLASSSSWAGLAKVDLLSGKVALQDESVKEETPSVKGGTPLDQLPPLVKELGAREKWQSAYVVGPRAYGQVDVGDSLDVGDPRHRVEHRVQAVDVATGKLLWQRAFEETWVGMPPP